MRVRGLWREPDFLKLWAGQSVSQVGSWITLVGLPIIAAKLLNATPLQMGFLSGAGAAAILLFGLFAGAWADRLRRRPILICADLGRAAVLFTLPLAAMLGKLTMTHLYAVAAAASALTVWFDVSYQAYLPSLVSADDLLEGNSKLALSESLAGVVGPGLTGALIAAITAPMAILFDAISFVCSALSVWLIRKPERRPEAHPAPHIGREIVEGLRASWNQSILRTLLLRAATAAVFLGFGSSLYILFAVRELKIGAALLGAVIAVGGFSSVFGALAAKRLVARFGLGPTLIFAALLPAAASLLPPLARGPVALCAAMLAVAQLGDMGWTIYGINELTLRQSVAPAHVLGRVNSAAHLTFRGVLPVGALLGGVIAQAIGLRAAMFVGAGGFLLSALWLICSPIRRLRELPNAAAAC
ncbi:MAG TPA: MFS transporter [Bryobacteraceae bacterium]|nr:MFS transporter [Bryobacteraceae bacterium]